MKVLYYLSLFVFLCGQSAQAQHYTYQTEETITVTNGVGHFFNSWYKNPRVYDAQLGRVINFNKNYKVSNTLRKTWKKEVVYAYNGGVEYIRFTEQTKNQGSPKVYQFGYDNNGMLSSEKQGSFDWETEKLHWEYSYEHEVHFNRTISRYQSFDELGVRVGQATLIHHQGNIQLLEYNGARYFFDNGYVRQEKRGRGVREGGG